MKEHKFELMPQSWFKRRLPQDEPKVVSFTVTGFEKCSSTYCDVEVELSNGEIHQLSARIYQLDNGDWKVHGLNPHGLSVLLKLIE